MGRESEWVFPNESAQALERELAAAKAENQRLRRALEDAWERMDRAIAIITGNSGFGWEMLNTTLDRKALEGEKP